MLPLVEFQWKTANEYEDALEVLESALKTLVQNVMSVVAVAALVHGGPKVEPRHAATAADYFHRKCPLAHAVAAQSGGSPLPASYFGAVEPMYSSMNPSGGSSQTVDFNMGVARADIPMSGGAGAAASRLPRGATAWVHHELQIYKEHHRLTVSKGAKEILTKLILRYITCLNHDLQKKQPLTIKKVREVLKKKSYKVFH